MSWWRLNRWGLIALIPALAFMLLSSSARVWLLYTNDRFINPRPPSNYVQSLPLGDSATVIVLNVALKSVEDVTGSKELSVPEGARAWLVRVDFEAPVESEIGACQVALHDQHDREFRPSPEHVLKRKIYISTSCDPSPPKDAPLGWKRPAKWTKGWLFVLPADAEPGWLELGWAPPDYIHLPLK